MIPNTIKAKLKALLEFEIHDSPIMVSLDVSAFGCETKLPVLQPNSIFSKLILIVSMGRERRGSFANRIVVVVRATISAVPLLTCVSRT